jgi:hypothetical protein
MGRKPLHLQPIAQCGGGDWLPFRMLLDCILHRLVVSLYLKTGIVTYGPEYQYLRTLDKYGQLTSCFLYPVTSDCSRGSPASSYRFKSSLKPFRPIKNDLE